MWGLIGTIFSWIVGLFQPNTRNDEVALGRAEQQIANNKTDLAVIAKANRAAETVSEKKVLDDDSDLDRGL